MARRTDQPEQSEGDQGKATRLRDRGGCVEFIRHKDHSVREAKVSSKLPPPGFDTAVVWVARW